MAKAIPTLDKEYRWPRTKRFMTTINMKDGLISKERDPDGNEIVTEKRLFEWIDYLADENIVNVLPCFLEFNAGALNPNIHLPHVQDEDGYFLLDKLNSEWWQPVRKRSRYITDRKIALELTFNDQGSINRKHSFWLPQENNHGWRGKKMYPIGEDKHYYGYKWPNYCLHGGECTPQEKEWYCNTGEYLQWRYKREIPWFKEFCGQFIIWRNNEMDNGRIWHQEMDKILSSYGINRTFRTTSVRFDDEDLPKMPELWKFFTYDEHAIRTLEDYIKRRDEMTWIERSWIGSPDGFGDNWRPTYPKLRKLVKQIYKDGNHYRGNDWFSETFGYDFNKIDYKAAKIVREEFENEVIG